MPIERLLICLAAGLTAVTLYPDPSLACSPAEPTALGVIPANGDQVLPDTAVLVLGEGRIPTESADIRLTNRGGSEVDVDADIWARPGVFKWAAVYRPTESLDPSAHDFFATYAEASPQGSISTSFEVQPGEPAELVEPTIEGWQTVYFTPDTGSECDSYASATRVVIGPARQGDTPLWYKVELTDMSTRESLHWAIVPGMAEGDGARVSRELHAPFEAGCLHITAMGADGELGPTSETCAPDACETAAAEQADSEELWQDMADCDRPEPGTNADADSSGGSSDGSACSVVGVDSSTSWPAILFVALLIAPGMRRRNSPLN